MSIHSHGKGCMNIMVDVVDTAFSYWKALILQESSKVKESSLPVI